MRGDRPSFLFSQRQSIAFVFGCTFFGAAAQILIKSGANSFFSISPWARIRRTER